MLRKAAGSQSVPILQLTEHVTVGKYTICRFDDNSVWIEAEGEEGGQFSNDTFEAAIDAYYRANF